MKLSSFQCYQAMYAFLSEVYDRMDNDALGALLNSLTLDRNKLPNNPQLKWQWEQLCASAGKLQFHSKACWYLMEEFLRNAAAGANVPQLDNLVRFVSLRENDEEFQEIWEKCLESAGSSGPDWPE